MSDAGWYESLNTPRAAAVECTSAVAVTAAATAGPEAGTWSAAATAGGGILLQMLLAGASSALNARAGSPVNGHTARTRMKFFEREQESHMSETGREGET